MTEILIREYVSEDRLAVEKCIFELQEDSYKAQPHFWAKPEGVLGLYLEKVLESKDKKEGKIFVGVLEGKTVGWAVVGIVNLDNAPDIVLKRYGYIPELSVMRDFHGRGVGRALLDKAEEYLRSKGITWIQLDVNKGNSALEFYKKCGYQERSIKLEKKL